MLTTTYPSSIGTVTRHYDEAGREYDLVDWASNTTTFVHDPDGNLTSQTTPNNITSTYTFDADDQTSAVGHVNTSTSSTLGAWSYTRYADGQLNSVTSTGIGTNRTWAYDALTRINTVSGRTYANTYDTAGNLHQQDSNTANSQTFDNANQLSTQVTGTTTTNFTYNNEGDRTQAAITGGATTNYSYDQANRYTGTSGNSSYTYNGDGLRMVRTVLTVTSYQAWDLTGPLPLLLVDGSTDFIYGPDGLPLEQIATATKWLYHDEAGSTRLITDGTGTSKGNYSYNTWGAIASHGGTSDTNLQYDGQYTDANGYQYLRNRYYDTSTGQFVTRDSLEAETRSVYGYVGNDPLNQADPAGLSTCGKPKNPLDFVGSLIDCGSKAAPDCFAWQQGCQSLVSTATSGKVCSRRFDAGCSEPIAEAQFEVCPAYGCVKETFDGVHWRFHYGLGMAFGLGEGLSLDQSSCAPHDELFGMLPPFGPTFDTNRPDGGNWSSPGLSLSYVPEVILGFGAVHWYR